MVENAIALYGDDVQEKGHIKQYWAFTGTNFRSNLMTAIIVAKFNFHQLKNE